MFKFIFKIIIAIIILIAVVLSGFYFLGRNHEPEQITYGISFSQKFANELELDWKETYLAILDDLNIKKLRLIAYWDLIEKEQGIYNFSDLDWQVKQAKERGAEIIMTIGYKLPRWPECHIPEWIVENHDFKKENSAFLKEPLLTMLETVVKHYKDEPSVKAWQIENEPFVKFGICPKSSAELLDQEIHLVKAFDSRPVIITDSGELSLWYRAGKRADIFGTTLYRKVWNKYLKYIDYPIPAWFYSLRAKMVKFFLRKPIIVSEMQAEPWGHKAIYQMSLDEQFKSMNAERLIEIIEFEKKTGISEVYFWGAEWWYWLKQKYNNDSLWQAVKNITQHLSK